MITELRLMGEPVHLVDSTPTYVVTYPKPISQQMADHIMQAWRREMGDRKLIMLDSGAKFWPLDPPEPTPIYDALVAERQAS